MLLNTNTQSKLQTHKAKHYIFIYGHNLKNKICGNTKLSHKGLAYRSLFNFFNVLLLIINHSFIQVILCSPTAFGNSLQMSFKPCSLFYEIFVNAVPGILLHTEIVKNTELIKKAPTASCCFVNIVTEAIEKNLSPYKLPCQKH